MNQGAEGQRVQLAFAVVLRLHVEHMLQVEQERTFQIVAEQRRTQHLLAPLVEAVGRYAPRIEFESDGEGRCRARRRYLAEKFFRARHQLGVGAPKEQARGTERVAASGGLADNQDHAPPAAALRE